MTPLPTNVRPISRWRDRDAAFVDIAEGIERAIQELQSFSVAVPGGEQTRLWNIPFPRNRFFLGRDDLLMELRRRLHADRPLAISQLQAISGLGGIGKTQLVLEYAYRFANDYQAVLWVRADSRETVTSGFLELARLFGLPEQEERDQAVVIHAVKGWLSQHEHWLLVLDNADDFACLSEFFPVLSAGHIVLTTRAQAVNQLANRLEVDVLEEEAGVLLLLRRAGILGLDAPLEQADDASYLLARQLCKELGWLPLALDQAGAYMEETQCGLQGYLDLFQQRRSDLLRQRGGIVQDHEAVATTWSLSFAAIERKSTVAADLLRLCAILHPDAIPEEILLQGASSLGEHLATLGSDPLALNHALAVLTSYSLIRRTSRERTLSIHHLVQVVLQDAMRKQEQAKWVQRAIEALDTVFPGGDHTTWDQCERLLPHVLACIGSELLREENLSLADLAFAAAYYLYQRARYAEAEPLFQRALRIRETALGAEHPDVAYSLNNLAALYYEQRKYAEAEPLFQRALRIWEAALGAEHPDVAYPLNGLANLYAERGKYEEAEPLYQRALRIREAALGAEHPQLASSLNNLANLYRERGKYEEAEPLYQRAVRIWESALGVEHPDVAYSLNNLAILYREQGKYAEAEPLYRRAIWVWEAALGAEHPKVVSSLNNLANLYAEQRKYAEAEPLYQRALRIGEAALGAEHPDVAYSLNNLAILYREQRKYAEAEPLFQRALRIWEAALGAEHPLTAKTRANHDQLLQQWKEAEHVATSGNKKRSAKRQKR